MDPKDIKCHLQWWGKYETVFPIVGFLAYQILSIVRSQIEIIFFFFCKHVYKPKEMSFIVKKIRGIDICEQKLAKCS